MAVDKRRITRFKRFPTKRKADILLAGQSIGYDDSRIKRALTYNEDLSNQFIIATPERQPILTNVQNSEGALINKKKRKIAKKKAGVQFDEDVVQIEEAQRVFGEVEDFELLKEEVPREQYTIRRKKLKRKPKSLQIDAALEPNSSFTTAYGPESNSSIKTALDISIEMEELKPDTSSRSDASIKSAFEPETFIKTAFEPENSIRSAFQPDATLKTEFEPDATVKTAFDRDDSINSSELIISDANSKSALRSENSIKTAFEPETPIRSALRPDASVRSAFEPDATVKTAFEPETSIKSHDASIKSAFDHDDSINSELIKSDANSKSALRSENSIKSAFEPDASISIKTSFEPDASIKTSLEPDASIKTAFQPDSSNKSAFDHDDSINSSELIKSDTTGKSALRSEHSIKTAFESDASIKTAFESDASIKTAFEPDASVRSAFEPDATVKTAFEPDATVKTAFEPDATVKTAFEPDATVKTAFEPETSIKSPDASIKSTLEPDASSVKSSFEPNNSIKSLEIHADASISGLNSELERMLDLCDKRRVITWEEFSTNASSFESCSKLGEGTYGEVFKIYMNGGQEAALKVIPFAVDPEECNKIVNEDFLKPPSCTFNELLITRELSKLADEMQTPLGGFITPTFIRLIRADVVRGVYPKQLLEAWDDFKDAKPNLAENQRPDEYSTETQHFMLIALSNGGIDLEAYKIQNQRESYSIFYQIALSLAIAEGSLDFEHRDLHVGNVLIGACNTEEKIKYIYEDETIRICSSGVKVSIIDFTNSRLTKDDLTVYINLANDEGLFEGKGDYQYDIYRLMRDENKNDWAKFTPRTNLLWLHYLSRKLFDIPRLFRKRREQLLKMFDSILKVDLIKDFLNSKPFLDEFANFRA